MVAGEHEARGGGAAQLGRDLLVGPRRGSARRATRPPARRPARRAAAAAATLSSTARLAHAARRGTAATSASPNGPVGPGHREVQRRVARALGVAGGAPVRHHEPVPAPLVLEHVAQQRRLGHRGAVDARCRPPSPPTGARPGSARTAQVELAQRALADPRVEREALGLGVVGDEVLDRRRDALGLQPAHVGRADRAGQQRVLAEALEVRARRAGLRCRLTVGASSTSTPLRARLERQQPARAARPAPRPRSRPARSATGRWPTARARPSSSPRTPAGPSDVTIRRSPTAGSCVQRPEIGAGEQAHLLLQAQRRQALVQEFLHDASVWIGRCGRCCSTCSGRASTGARRDRGEAERFGLPPEIGRRLARRSTSRSWRPCAAAQRPWVNLDVLHRIGLDRVLERLRADARRARARRAHRRPGTGSTRGPTSSRASRSSRRATSSRPCSNGHIAQSVNLAKYAKLPWDAILGAEIAHAYKPDPRVYRDERRRARPRAARGVHGRRAPRRPDAAGAPSACSTAFVPRPARSPKAPDFEADVESPGTSWSCRRLRMKHLAAGWLHGRALPVLRRRAAVEVQPRLGPDRRRCCSSGSWA